MELLKDFLHQSSWRKVLEKEFQQDYFIGIEQFLRLEEKTHEIFPEKKIIFSAFNSLDFKSIKVVILGQDPYHGKGQANGLSFSVNTNSKIPPSLKNIFKELNEDVGIEMPTHGNLSSWSEQGVLLLNATLTVRADTPNSHKKIGWEIFTDKVIQIISEKKKNIVFLLWGNFAHSKEKLIDSTKHLILKAAHPSPLARGAFFGSKPFSKTNSYLKEKQIEEINWRI